MELFKDKYRVKMKQFQHGSLPLELYSDLVWYLDEPISDTAVLPAYELARYSRECGRVVMLSGMGGDELDAGYARHQVLKNISLFRCFVCFPDVVLKLIFKGKKLRDIRRLKHFVKSPTPRELFCSNKFFKH